MDRFTRQTRRFYCRGLDLNAPLDAIRDGYYPILENVRSYQDGTIQPRPGLTDVNAVIIGQTPVHSVRRLNDPLNSTWARLVGSGTKLGYGQNSFSTVLYNGVDLAFSGDPLAMVPYRPDQSPESWMYIADSAAMYKVNRSGTAHTVGLADPTTPPTTELSTLVFGTEANFQSTVGWTVDGTILTTAPATTHRVDISTVTTTKVLYDSGSIGWCSVVLPATALSVLGVGAILTVVTAGPVFTPIIVHEVYKASSSVKIASVLYDSGTSGLCTIQPDQPVDELLYNSVVLLNGTIYSRILSVVDGPNGTRSFRCNTSGTVSAGQSLAVVGSIRVHDNGAAMNPAGGEAIGQDAITTGCGPGTNGTGWLNNNVNIDLSKFTISGTGYLGGAINDDDFLHLSLKISDLSLVTQGRIMFNCDAEATPTYTKNFFYRAFRPSDLLAASKGTQTSLDNRNVVIQHKGIDSQILTPAPTPERQIGGPRNRDENANGSLRGPAVPTPPVVADLDPNNPGDSDGSGNQTGTGDNQWCELVFRRRDLIRVGNDASRSYANINGFRLELSINTGAVTIEVNSLSLWGSYELDSSELAEPYYYRYRYRVSTTGASSNWSPGSLNTLSPKREATTVTCTASSAPEVDKIDIERWGGTATEWLYIGTTANSSTAFIDTISDTAARDNAALSDDDVNFQPWPITDTPKAGTASTVAGTMVKDSGTSFNLAWAKGTGIKVNGIDTSIRRVLTTSLLEVDLSLGAFTSVPWEIAEPVLKAQPLPAFWGPWNNRAFACGSTRNPGTLYISNAGDFDSTQEFLKLEITAPSEPLVNGCVYNGRNYVFSTERMFEIQEIGPNTFIYSEVPNGKGLWSRWGLAVGTRIFFLSKDGIYETFGGEPTSITDKTLYPLFPNEGSLGIAVNGFNPPNMVSGQETKFRLSYYDNYLYFDYVDTSAARRTMVYTADLQEPGWFPDTYTPGITYHYGEEGQGVHNILCCGANTTTGRLYSLAGTSDNGTAIAGHIRTGALDADDRRADKLWGDFIVDADTNNVAVTATLGLNNYSSLATTTPATLNTSSRSQTIFDISSGNGVEAKNTMLDLTWSTTSGTPKFFLHEPSFIPRPETTKLREAEWDDLDIKSDKFWQGVYIEADTGGVNRTIQVYKDDGTVADTLTVNHPFRCEKPYSFSSAFTSYMTKLLPVDANQWKFYGYRYIAQPEPPLVTRWESQQTSHGYTGYQHYREIWLTLTNTATVTLTITRLEDGTTWSYDFAPGTRLKTYKVVAPIKGKGFKYLLTSSAGFRIYKDDCGVMIKSWASNEQFRAVNPFGAEHGDGAAPI